MKRLFLVIPLLCSVFAVSAFAQRTVTGKVTTAPDGIALRGVRISVKGTVLGGVTDGSGVFRIANFPEGPRTLVFSLLGYKRQEISIRGDQNSVNVTLSEDIKGLDEVVVTAFGVERERKALGYAVQELSAADIAKANEPNIVNALQGKVAGVIINNSGGAPGAGANILIRGITSLDPSRNNQPLFVVDGIIISNSTINSSVTPSSGSNSAGSGEQFSMTNRAADINPDDIENINILKGATATALYGLRAANGVIVITTKKGSAGKTSITVNHNTGIDLVGKTPTVQQKWGQGAGGLGISIDNTINPATGLPFFLTGTGGGSGAFWSYGAPRSLTGEELFDNYRNFFDVGTRVNTSVAVSGGTNNATFYTSVARLDQKGIVPNTSFDRTNINIRGKMNFDDRLTVGASVNFSQSNNRTPLSGDQSIFSALAFWIPSFDVRRSFLPNGDYGGQFDVNTYTNGTIDHPMYVAQANIFDTRVNRAFGDAKVNYVATSWLNLSYQLTFDYFNDARRRINPHDLGSGFTNGGFIVEDSRNFLELNSQFLASLTYDFTDDLKGQLLLGNAVTSIDVRGLSMRGENFQLRGFYDISNTQLQFNNRIFSQQLLYALFFDAKFSYKDYLFLNITGRNDWSSTLPAQNRSFFYPGVNLSWVFTDMLKDTFGEWFNQGKLRASWGQVGKDANAYSIGTFYTTAGAFPIGSVAGFVQATASGDQNLRPELTTSIEIGADLKFFDNRLTIDATYFNNRIKDQIVSIPVSNATGFSRLVANSGTLENTGIELLVGGTPISTPDFTWDISLNWSKIQGRVLTMPNLINEIVFQTFLGGVATNKIVTGGAVGEMYGYDFNRAPDGQVIINANGLPTVNQTQQVLVGNALPDWTGGITNTFRYGGLSLSFLLEIRKGGLLMDMSERNRFRNGISGWTEPRYTSMIWNGVMRMPDGSFAPNTIPVQWTGPGGRGANPNTAEFIYRNDAAVALSHQYNLQDASWVRLRNVQVGYDFPRKMLEGSAFSSVRITLTGNNVWVSTPFRGFDPEGLAFGSGLNSFGFTGRNTPAVQSYSIGVQLGF